MIVTEETYMPLPENPPLAFNESYYENCKERELYNDPILTKEQYWDIWKVMVEHKEVRT